MSRATTNLLLQPNVSRLAIAVEEAARAANTAKPRFVEPAQGTLDRARSRRHHIVFGRRGSGKTSLLAKAASELTIDRRPIAFVNLETFKGHSYPDVLLSVLLETFSEFKKWLETAATAPASKTSFWQRLFGTAPSRGPLRKQDVQALVTDLAKEISNLRDELHAPETAEVTAVAESANEATKSEKLGASIKASVVSADASSDHSDRSSSKRAVTEQSRKRKIDFLLRHIIDYQQLIRRIAEVSAGDAFLFLDDLYHIRRADQAEVVDYFHRIAKGNRLWLKIGTIRHRTEWYRHSNPPVGLKLGDDADEIDLDLTLEKYRLTKQFLMAVLNDIAEEAEFPQVGTLLAPTAIDRLVLASGGVARDFLALFRRSMDVARERLTGEGGGARGQRIVAQDVNQAAGEHDSAKRDELKRDTLEERQQIEGAFESVKTFCLDQRNANCFVIQKDRTDAAAMLIEELVDLRLLHLVKSRVTISDRPGKLYVGYMLDLGQYVGERKRRGLEMIPFWQKKGSERMRRSSLIYEPVVPTGWSYPQTGKEKTDVEPSPR